MAAAVVAGIFAVVLFPLWPMVMRQGVWYLSVGLMILLGLFFAMAIFRLILFCVTVFVVPPGLWLFPNLFEDVGVIDSFKPLWGWQEVCSLSCPYTVVEFANDWLQTKKKKSKKGSEPAPSGKETTPATATTTATPASDPSSGPVKMILTPQVEEVPE